MSKDTTATRDEYRRDNATSDRSPLHDQRIRDVAERAMLDPVDLSFDEIRELGAAVVAHLRADPRL